MRVLVTGTSTGIGEATVRRLDKDGHTVFAGVRREEDGRKLEEGSSPRLTPVLLDVTDEAAIEAAVKTITDQVGASGLDGLVNNAGFARGGPLEYLPLEEWRTQLEVNIIGQVAVTQAFIPLLRQAGASRLVFVGSIGGRLGTPLMSPYNASKFAIAGIAESLRHELRPFGIKVSLVEPGGVKTAIWEKGQAYADELEERLPKEAFERYRLLIEGLRKGVEFQMRHAIGADKVADTIMHALESPRPRARYLVGRDAAVVGVTTRLLPDRVRDALVHRLGS
jgi:NAD(P)-dependent dehydrogenase (short-subunit alcohol dehydrogenase family)